MFFFTTRSGFSRVIAARLRPVFIGCIVCAITCVGCMSPSHRVQRYLAANPNRPDTVRQALSSTTVVAGMTAEEVTFVLGKPNQITPRAGTPPSGEIWYYHQCTGARNKLQNSSMWQLDVPQSTVYFNINNNVDRIVSYDDIPPAASQSPDPVSLFPSPSAVAKTNRIIRPVEPATIAPLSNYHPLAEEINVYGWPQITLQGISGSSSTRNAVLNGNVCEAGEYIDGVLIDGIFANGVVLVYHQSRAFLRPGESTIRPTQPNP